MREKIVCRFATEEDFARFCFENELKLSANTKSYDINTGEILQKRIVKSKPKKEAYWETQWTDMPEYVSEDEKLHAKIEFIFGEHDLKIANEMFQQTVTEKTTSVWFPKLIPGLYSTKRAVGGKLKNKYPIYVVSKGRHDKCTTSRFLTQMEVNHFVVVEPNEVILYKESLENTFAEIIELDMAYKMNYNTFDDLGDSKSKGPGAARNFCWDHAIKYGCKKHWVMDDNATEGFHYMFHNEKIKARTGVIFRACEDFVDRYDNVAIAGMNYSQFCVMSQKYPAFSMNTRIYSFLLIDNSIPYRWRGRYNEDTDLSLRVLKDGLCTIQFNAFLAGKATTQTVKGGNTEEFYDKEGTYPKSKMLEDMHPDVAKVVWKFNRWHHQVDYSSFKQPLIKKRDSRQAKPIKDYGIQIINTEEKLTTDTRTFLENKYKHLLKKDEKIILHF